MTVGLILLAVYAVLVTVGAVYELSRRDEPWGDEWRNDYLGGRR